MPSRNVVVPVRVPATQGNPNSRQTMAHGAAHVGDHRFGKWKQRSPAGIGRPAHQDSALVDVGVVEIADDAHGSLGDAGANP
jgi:hypothetical protein